MGTAISAPLVLYTSGIAHAAKFLTGLPCVLRLGIQPVCGLIRGFHIDYALRTAYNNVTEAGIDNVAPKQLEFRKRVEITASFLVVIDHLVGRDEVVEITRKIVLPVHRNDEVGLDLPQLVISPARSADRRDDRKVIAIDGAEQREQCILSCRAVAEHHRMGQQFRQALQLRDGQAVTVRVILAFWTDRPGEDASGCRAWEAGRTPGLLCTVGAYRRPSLRWVRGKSPQVTSSTSSPNLRYSAALLRIVRILL